MDTRATSFDGRQLVAGVQIFDVTGEAVAARVARSDGTVVADADDYEHGTRIPRKPWTPLQPGELSRVEGDTAGFMKGSSVAVVRVPDELVAAIGRTELFSDPASIEPAIIRFATLLSVGARAPPRLLGPNSRRIGLPTSTYDPRTSQLIGLHVDSFYGQPIASRHLAPNRLCLNAGREDRFLLFINLTLLQMRNTLMEAGVADPRVTGNSIDVGDVFMAEFPDYPVLKLTVRPGEAYIAPTENVIHDSTTEDKIERDVTITLLGEFALPSSGGA
ncbi:hypothetical protein IC762_31330 [Bradyrhizobium genosp. L]|uniref:hypothetical protein n=1 Tax=Bradyrhizobium genosp. L TaxID=83637 RepID=UPI0018A25BCC|nr:hypothetical protein [Bradyrhizobium genosp. L]QPF84075.1 hypothetical protein IC762_31330 [Bradyrhizobium genosp. L]